MTRSVEDGAGLRMAAVRFLLLAGFLAVPAAAAADTCQYIDCNQHCSMDRPENYKPQMCDKCCPAQEGTSSGGSNAAASTNDRLAALEKTVGELQVMTGVLLALVVLLMLLLLAVATFFLHSSKTLADFHMPVFFRKNKSHVQEKQLHKSSNGVDPNSTVIKMPNSQCNRSPLSKRASLSKGAAEHMDDSEGIHDLGPRPFRTRQPSESTCPEESSDMPDHAYDNLALSTSTIHNTSNSSTDTLGPAVSVNTLETTLPSGNHTSTHGGTTQV